MSIHFWINLFRNLANALNTLPGDYIGNDETQKNWRGFTQLMEHVA